MPEGENQKLEIEKNLVTRGENTQEHRYANSRIHAFERALSRCHQPLLTSLDGSHLIVDETCVHDCVQSINLNNLQYCRLTGSKLNTYSTRDQCSFQCWGTPIHTRHSRTDTKLDEFHRISTELWKNRKWIVYIEEWIFIAARQDRSNPFIRNTQNRRRHAPRV